jgi:predicted dehydrogenase/nucleoside-diphosphate-sugar epimerase
MKILVTGGTGFVGSHVVDYLLAEGHAVRVLARRTGNIERLLAAGVEVVPGDLADADSLDLAVDGREVLVNVATTMGGTARELELGTIQGSARLFQIARAAGVRRLVHISSIAVLPTAPPPGQPALLETADYETSPSLCVGYVAGKQATEKAALQAAEEGWEVFVLRPGIVFGPRGHWVLSRLGYAAGSRFFLIGSGRNLLPSTYVENLADAVVTAIAAEPSAAGIHHIIDDERVSQNEFVSGYREHVTPSLKIWHVPGVIARLLMFAGERGKRLLLGRNPFHRGHIEGCLKQVDYSTERARTVLGWKPPVPKAEALRRSYADWAQRAQISRKANLAALDARLPAVEKRVRVALVGCGGISDIHAGFLRGIESVEIVGCYDSVVTSAQRLAEKFKLPVAAATLDELFARARPEVVHLLTPPQHTAAVARDCLRRGCHVLVEKPMALNAAQARELAQIAEANGVRLCVDHNHVYDRVTVEVRRLVETGALGKIIWVDSYYGFDLRGNPGNPLLQPDAGGNWNYSLSGGLFQNLLPHPLAVALEFTPGPVSVRALARFFGVLAHQPNDELRLMLQTPSTCGLVTVSLASSPKAQTLQLYGTKGNVFVDFTHKLVIRQSHLSRMPRAVSRLVLNLRWGTAILASTARMTWRVARKKWVHYDGMERLFREFYRALRENRPVPVTPEEGIRVMELMDETWRQIGPQTNAAVPRDVMHPSPVVAGARNRELSRPTLVSLP